MDLIERIDRWGNLLPDRIAHISGDQTMTYAQLCQRSDLLAAWLARNLPDDGSPVAVFGHKQPEMLVAFLGAAKAGRAYIPIDDSLPEQRVRMIIETSKAAIVLTPEKVRELLNEQGALPAGFAAHHPAGDDPWYIMFTSGSTGNPKGVVITYGCLESFFDWTLAEQNFVERQETFLNQVPFSFDVSIMDLYSSLVNGGTLFSLPRETFSEPKQLYQSLAQSGITVWVSTPSFAQLCLVEPAFSAAMLPHLRKFWFCGETLAPQVVAELLKRFPNAEVWNTYGPTEVTVATTSVRVDQEMLARYSPLPVGYPKPGCVIRIIADGVQATGEGRGEIVIAGANVSPGYLHRPDLTARVFYELDGLRAYRTGDLGHYRDGLVFFDGRIDFQIKLHGYRIEIGDIESNLHVLANVRDAVVIPVQKDGQVEYLTAFVILKDRPAGSDFEISRALKRELGERLPDYMLPRKFFFVTQFPMTVNGKADRRKLAESL